MNKAQPLSLAALSKTSRRLALLASRESLAAHELTPLLLTPLARTRQLVAALSPQLGFWQLYSTWSLRTQSNPAPSTYYFQVNLAKLQPFYTTLAGAHRVHHTFSTGCILRLYRITTKRDRRKVEKGPLALRFFKRFFKQYFARADTTAVCLGYRRRYAFFMATALLPFMRRYARSLAFTPQALTGAFSFRRVKAIKKRIRKRLGSRAR